MIVKLVVVRETGGNDKNVAEGIIEMGCRK